MDMREVRMRFPQYDDMGDVELATALHRKFYSDMPVADFYKKVGLTESPVNAAEDMSGIDQARAGLGKVFVDLGRGIAQTFTTDGSDAGKSIQQGIDQSRESDRALLETGGGFAGNLAGNIALGAATAAIPGANTVAGSAALGGLLGGLQPTDTGESALNQAAIGGILGGGGQLVGNAIPSLAKAVVQPFTSRGRDQIVAETLERFATNPNAIDDAARARLNIPGLQMNLAEASQDPGLARLAIAADSLDPAISGPLSMQRDANIGAIRQAIGGVAGDDAAREVAVAARRQATQPLYTAVRDSDALVDTSRTVNLIDRVLNANPGNKALTGPLREIRETLFETYPAEQRGRDAWKVLDDALQGRNAGAPGSLDIKTARTVLHRLKTGQIAADDALSELRKIKPKGKQFTEALDLAKRFVETPDFVIRQNPQQVKSVVDNVNALLANPANSTVKRELTLLKKSLTNQIGKAVPEYREANRRFADMSRPINQMDIGTALKDKLVSALSENPGASLSRVRAEQYAQALRNPSSLIKSATGMRNRSLEDLMASGQMQTLREIEEYLARSASATDKGLGRGSPTARNLVSQNIMRQITGPMGLPESWGESVLSQTLGRAVDTVARPADEAIQRGLVEALMNPARAQELQQALIPSQQQQMARALYGYSLPALSIGSGAYAAGQ
jgi:hypothetical protein